MGDLRIIGNTFLLIQTYDVILREHEKYWPSQLLTNESGVSSISVIHIVGKKVCIKK